MHALGAVVVALSLSAGLYGLDLRLDHERAPVTLTAVQQPEGTAMAAYDPTGWNGTVFALLIGSDERPGLDGRRADALHVVGLNPAAGRATILNIPRDTWVDIPGRGQGRVNEAYHYGGAPLQVETVRRLTGAPISYVLVTTFAGLESMVDALGGVNVQVPFHMNDRNSGAAFDAGMQRLNGRQALAFSRNRHIPDGDIRRTANQGQLIVHALSDLRGKGTSGTDILRYLDVLYRNVRPHGIGSTELFRLGRAALAVNPGNVRNFTIPARVGMRGSASVVFLRQPLATNVLRDFADDGVLQAH